MHAQCVLPQVFSYTRTLFFGLPNLVSLSLKTLFYMAPEYHIWYSIPDLKTYEGIIVL